LVQKDRIYYNVSVRYYYCNPNQRRKIQMLAELQQSILIILHNIESKSSRHRRMMTALSILHLMSPSLLWHIRHRICRNTSLKHDGGVGDSSIVLKVRDHVVE